MPRPRREVPAVFFTIRLDKDLRDNLRKLAKRKGVTMTKLISKAVIDILSRQAV